MSPAVLAIWALFFCGAILILLPGGDSMPWRLNQRLDRDVTARVAFEVADEVRTEQERQTAAATAPDIYIANEAPLVAISGKLTELLQVAAASADDPAVLAADLSAKGWDLDEAGLEALRSFAGEQGAQDYQRRVRDFIAGLENQYVVDGPAETIRSAPAPTALLVRTGRPPIRVLTSDLRMVTDRRVVEQVLARLAGEAFPPALAGPVADMVARTLSGGGEGGGPARATAQALWLFDPVGTAEGIEKARQAVKVHVATKKAGDILVRAGSVLSSAELDLLQQEHQAFQRAQREVPELRRKRLLAQLGMAGVVLLVTVGMAIYAASYQDRILQRPARALGLTALVLVMLLLSRLNEQLQHPFDSPVEFSVALVVITAGLLTIAYTQRFAFGAAGGACILATIASRGDLGLFLTQLAALGTTVFTLREVRTRGKLIAVGAMAGVAAFLACSSTLLSYGQGLSYVIPHALSAAGAALAAGFILQGILQYFERLFGIATSMTLLEWCDASRPLLRRLAQEAPGTYSHSLILSQMAEEAAESIGSNGLLARVGALYHDIGKIQKTRYFVENQQARMNRHDGLAPTMSLLIIVAHVKDGLEMARAYGLPRVLLPFIAEHHGTTVVRYFHHAANEAAARRSRGRHDREIPESEFRYPGPKPRSKESAILMICDGCEGAVRALSEPTPGRIESMVHQVVMDRLNDGQFDDCDITMRELNLVEQSVVRSLCAIHHGRIKYPKSGERPARPGAGTDAVEPPVPAGAQERARTAASEVPAPEVASQA